MLWALCKSDTWDLQNSLLTSGDNMTTNVETFKKIYLQEFGAALTDEEVTRKAQSLMKLYKAVYGSPVITIDYEKSSISNKD